MLKNIPCIYSYFYMKVKGVYTRFHRFCQFSVTSGNPNSQSGLEISKPDPSAPSIEPFTLLYVIYLTYIHILYRVRNTSLSDIISKH